jgi:ABC-type multidrug transport system ATPase subunit
MITKFSIASFKRLGSVDLELGDFTVFIGPNNSGKTTALQALALWDIGRKRWSEKHLKNTPIKNKGKRTGVTINRRDLYAIPVPSAKLLWNDLRTQSMNPTKNGTEKIYIVLKAEGLHQGKVWACAFRFYYANAESFYCDLEGDNGDGVIPDGAKESSIVFLPPMSGLSGREHRKEPGEINVLIGEGQTAQILRNLCWQLFDRTDKRPWELLVRQLKKLFHIELQEPMYIKERAEITLTYKEQNKIELDLASAGRGCQQVLLLLAFMLANPSNIVLLDEPDAHLEILRQRDVYNLIAETARANNTQIVAASHSEVILQEAVGRDVVMAFIGKPRRIDDNTSRTQVKKALVSIASADYYIALQKGWMLYVEGSTDLAILSSLAERLEHPVANILSDSVPVHYLGGNEPTNARDHFYGLHQAKPDLTGIAIFDRIDKKLNANNDLVEKMWSKREIENYLVTPDSLIAFVNRDCAGDDMFAIDERARNTELMNKAIEEMTTALKLTQKPDPWGADIKVSDDFLDPLFALFYSKLGTPQRDYKRDYHELSRFVSLENIDKEVGEMLDAIYEVANRAMPAQ